MVHILMPVTKMLASLGIGRKKYYSEKEYLL
jgi:hypothetical protein